MKVEGRESKTNLLYVQECASFTCCFVLGFFFFHLNCVTENYLMVMKIGHSHWNILSENDDLLVATGL